MGDYVDVMLVGAGIAGICAVSYLQPRCPHTTYALHERSVSLGVR